MEWSSAVGDVVGGVVVEIHDLNEVRQLYTEWTFNKTRHSTYLNMTENGGLSWLAVLLPSSIVPSGEVAVVLHSEPSPFDFDDFESASSVDCSSTCVG